MSKNRLSNDRSGRRLRSGCRVWWMRNRRGESLGRRCGWHLRDVEDLGCGNCDSGLPFVGVKAPDCVVNFCILANEHDERKGYRVIRKCYQKLTVAEGQTNARLNITNGALQPQRRDVGRRAKHNLHL